MCLVDELTVAQLATPVCAIHHIARGNHSLAQLALIDSPNRSEAVQAHYGQQTKFPPSLRGQPTGQTADWQ